MKQYYKFTQEGYYLEPVIALYTDTNPMPSDVTDIRPPDGLYRAQFNGTEWVETGAPPAPDLEQLANTVRAQRDTLLTECDTIYCNAERWNSYSDEQKAAWRAYKQALRDVPEQAGFPTQVTWAEKPNV